MKKHNQLNNIYVYIAFIAIFIMCSGCVCKKKQQNSLQSIVSEGSVALPFEEALYSDLPFLPCRKNSCKYIIDKKRTVFEFDSTINFFNAIKYLKNSSESLGWRLIDEFSFNDQLYMSFDRPTKKMMIHSQEIIMHPGPSFVKTRLCITSNI